MPPIACSDDYVLLNFYSSALMNTRLKRPLEIGNLEGTRAVAEAERRLSLENRMCNGFLIHNSRFPGCDHLPSPEDVDAWGGNLIFFFRTNDPWNAFRCQEAGLPVEEFVEKRVNEILSLMKALPEGKVWWFFGGEQWNSGHPHLRLEEYDYTSKGEAFRWYQHWVTTNEHQVHWRNSKFGDSWDPGIPCVFQYLKRKGIALRELSMGGGGAVPLDVHYQHELGLKMSFVEVFSSTPCTQIAVAFCRGAARQYDAFWSIYHPPHNYPAPTYTEVPKDETRRVTSLIYDREMRRLGGPTESMLLRCWVVAHFSGTDINYMDGAPYVNWVEAEENTLRLTPAGRNAKRFADLVLRKKKSRGRPYVPVALLLEHNHGWTPGRGGPMRAGHDVTWYKLPFTAGDYMIENFFDAAFPGHSLYRRPRPWKTSEEQGRMMLEGFDFRPYEFKCVTSSTWGDSFDVLLDNASSDTLKKYKGIITLGELKLDRSDLEALHEYVSKGGILLANAEQIADIQCMQELFGVSLTSEKGKAAGSRCNHCGAEFEEPPYSYRVAELESATPQAVTEEGYPLVTMNRVGRGMALLAMPDYFQAYDSVRLMAVPTHRIPMFYGVEKKAIPQRPHSHTKLSADGTALLVPFNKFLAIAKDTISHFMDRVSILKVNRAPIEYLVNTTQEGIIVVLVNNEGSPWDGQVSIELPAGQVPIVEEWWEGEAVDCAVKDDVLALRPRVPEFDFRIYSIRYC